MKKVFILGLSAVVLAGGVISCGKTTKGKMANEWTVSAYDLNDVTTYSDGDKSTSTQVLAGNALNSTEVYAPNGGSASTSTSTMTVNEWSYTIDKDGTWSSVSNTTSTGLDSTFNITTFEYDTYVVTENEVTNMSGVYNFVGKSKTEEFKKNERVLFNTLASTSVSTRTEGGDAAVVTTDEVTLIAGDYITVYTVVESKGKELSLEVLSDVSNTYTGGTYNSESTTSMTLTQK
jgi:carbohydrate-selective porin OprB